NAMIERYQRPEQLPDAVVSELKDKLKKIYHRSEHTGLVDELSREDLVRMVRKVREGVHVATPVFDGASESEIRELLTLAGLPSTGQMVLFDGRTGDPFEQDVTVGVMYILKLHHLVDDKIHA